MWYVSSVHVSDRLGQIVWGRFLLSRYSRYESGGKYGWRSHIPVFIRPRWRHGQLPLRAIRRRFGSGPNGPGEQRRRGQSRCCLTDTLGATTIVIFEFLTMCSRIPFPLNLPMPRSRYEPNTIASAPHPRAACRILDATELTGALRTAVLAVAPLSWTAKAPAAASPHCASCGTSANNNASLAPGGPSARWLARAH